jgi:hypothetical protein
LGNRIYLVATRILDEAQEAIAEDWIGAYQKYVGRSRNDNEDEHRIEAVFSRRFPSGLVL